MARRANQGGGGGANDELPASLEDYFSLRVSSQELDAPTPALVMSVLQVALSRLGLNKAALEMPHTLLPAQQAHIEGSVPLLHYLALMQRVFQPLGIEDVGLADLVDPKPKRTRRLFVTLVNNWFRTSYIFNTYKEKEQQYLAARAENDCIQARLDTNIALYNKLGTWLASMGQKTRSMTAELDDCSWTLQVYSAKKAAITALYQQLKVTHCASYEAVQRAKLELGDVAEAAKEAQASVCGVTADWKDKTAAHTEKLATLERERDELRTTVLALEEKIGMASVIKDALQATLEDVARLEAWVAKIEERKKAKEATEEKRVKLERLHCDLQNEVKVASEELARLNIKIGGGQPRDIDASLQNLEQRHCDLLRKSCEEKEAA